MAANFTQTIDNVRNHPSGAANDFIIEVQGKEYSVFPGVLSRVEVDRGARVQFRIKVSTRRGPDRLNNSITYGSVTYGKNSLTLAFLEDEFQKCLSVKDELDQSLPLNFGAYHNEHMVGAIFEKKGDHDELIGVTVKKPSLFHGAVFFPTSDALENSSVSTIEVTRPFSSKEKDEAEKQIKRLRGTFVQPVVYIPDMDKKEPETPPHLIVEGINYGGESYRAELGVFRTFKRSRGGYRGYIDFTFTDSSKIAKTWAPDDTVEEVLERMDSTQWELEGTSIFVLFLGDKVRGITTGLDASDRFFIFQN